MAATDALAEAEAREYQANIPRFFAYSTLQSFQLWMPIWIVYLQHQRGLSLAEVALLDAPFFLIQVAAEIPTGALADRFGRKASLLVGAGITTIGVFVFGIADSYGLILISYTFWGIGATLQSGADQAFLFDSLKVLKREGEFSRIYGRLNAANVVAILLASLLGAPLAAQTDLATPVIVSAGICAISAVIALSFKEPPHQEGRLPYLQTIGAGIRQVSRRPALRLTLLFGVLAAGSFWAPGYFAQPYLVGHGVTIASLGLFLVPMRLFSILASVYAHHLESRFGAWTAIALTPVVSISCCLGLAAFDSVYAFAFMPMVSAAGTTRMLLTSHYINSRIESGQRATVISIYALVASAGSAVFIPLYGYLADERSLRFLYGFVGVFSLVMLPLVLWMWRRADKAEAVDIEQRTIRPAPNAP